MLGLQCKILALVHESKRKHYIICKGTKKCTKRVPDKQFFFYPLKQGTQRPVQYHFSEL